VTEAETRRPQAWARAINTLGHAGAETRQTPVALVLGEIGAVERNDQPVEAGGRHSFDVAGEKPAIGDHAQRMPPPAIAETRATISGCTSGSPPCSVM
jgi:hypothetical protein